MIFNEYYYSKLNLTLISNERGSLSQSDVSEKISLSLLKTCLSPHILYHITLFNFDFRETNFLCNNYIVKLKYMPPKNALPTAKTIN